MLSASNVAEPGAPMPTEVVFEETSTFAQNLQTNQEIESIAHLESTKQTIIRSPRKLDSTAPIVASMGSYPPENKRSEENSPEPEAKGLPQRITDSSSSGQ